MILPKEVAEMRHGLSHYLETKAVHGSGRVGFVPNPDSTCMHRVGKNLTYNRLE